MSILIRGMEMPKNCCECPFGLARFDRLPKDEKGYVSSFFTCVLTERALTSTKRNRACPLVEVEEFEVWPNKDKSRKFTILKTKGGMHFMGPNGPVDPPKGEDNDD